MPSANAIVNKLLLDSDGIDDPARYLDWLKRKADIGDIFTISFGVAIRTTDDAMITANADEHQIDIESQEAVDQLQRDMAIIEANAFAILRKMWLAVNDEGHNGDGDRIASVWFRQADSTDASIKDLLEIVLNVTEAEPARTDSGTLNSLHPDATRMIYQNVSDLGQNLIDVDIVFFDTDKLQAWADLNLFPALTTEHHPLTDAKAIVNKLLVETKDLSEGLNIPPEDEPTRSDLTRVFNPNIILKALGYYYKDGLWRKEIKRSPARQDIMIEVRRRRQTTSDDADTLYDFHIYVNHGNVYQQFHHVFGKTVLQLRDSAKRIDAWIAAKARNPMPESLGDPRRENQKLPAEDNPEAVLRTHQQGLFVPELNRLNFRQGKSKTTGQLFGEKIPSSWFKTYQAADGATHAVSVFIINISSGNAIQFNVYDTDFNQWHPQWHPQKNLGRYWPRPTLHPQTTAQAAAALRDIDAAMERSAAQSLPLEQEWEMIHRVVQHYNRHPGSRPGL